jgi:hypothetical protein
MRHSPLLKGFESHQDAAKAITDLRYDALRDLLYAIAEQLDKDAKADSGRERFKLAQSLENASFDMLSVAKNINWAWDISEPFMKEG